MEAISCKVTGGYSNSERLKLIHYVQNITRSMAN